MTPKISLITAMVGATLVFAVPAWGDNWAADKAQTAAVSPEWFERAATVAVQKHEAMLDARERSFAAKQDSELISAQYPDWFERAAAAAVRTNRVPVVDDRFRIDPSSTPDPVAVGSSRELEWPQIGIGFGVGIVLMLGIYLAVRATRPRPIAH